MPVEKTPGSGTEYHLISFDADGRERTDDAAGLMSENIVSALRRDPITDVFILSHGWQGDVPSAKKQYGKWIDAVVACTADRERMERVHPGYRSLIVGLHWPSLAWGDEELDSDHVSFGAPGDSPLAALVDQYAERLADTPAARTALETILSSALESIAPDELPPAVRAAYLALDAESSLGSGSEDPGADREPFDPDRVYEAELEGVSFGLPKLGGLLAPLRMLSFWKMKDRAKKFGETGGFGLLQKIQLATSDKVRVHLMGHSFGCIVVSATLAGPAGNGRLVRPVSTLMLVQGALSLWSYCSDIPPAPGRAGFFRSVVAEGKVQGPILTTISAKDTAVGRFYPIGAGARRDVQFGTPGDLPKYGGVGSFGVRGPGLQIEDLEMRPADVPYGFEAGRIYNLESTRYICEGGGTSGAHSDIAKPEVAHAFWCAVL